MAQGLYTKKFWPEFSYEYMSIQEQEPLSGKQEEGYEGNINTNIHLQLKTAHDYMILNSSSRHTYNYHFSSVHVYILWVETTSLRYYVNVVIFGSSLSD